MTKTVKEIYLECHAVPKSELISKAALLWFMISLSIPVRFAAISACFASLYKGIRTSVEIPNL